MNIKLVIFSVVGGKLKVLLTESKLPSGLPGKSQTLDQAASGLFGKNIKVPLHDLYFEQLYTFSSQKQQEISVVYYFLMPEHKIYPDINDWKAITDKNIDKTDREIIRYAVQRLQWKIEYTNAVYSLLPDEFTFSQLQSVYEGILGKKLDKRNFRKKIMALNLLKATGHKRKEGRSRPAQIYAFRKKELTFVKILQPAS